MVLYDHIWCYSLTTLIIHHPHSPFSDGTSLTGNRARQIIWKKIFPKYNNKNTNILELDPSYTETVFLTHIQVVDFSTL